MLPATHVTLSLFCKPLVVARFDKLGSRWRPIMSSLVSYRSRMQPSYLLKMRFKPATGEAWQIAGGYSYQDAFVTSATICSGRHDAPPRTTIEAKKPSGS